MKTIKFSRYGGLSPVKQEGYTNDESKMTFHTPPARKGIYCFPDGGQERFLLGKGHFDNRRMVKVDPERLKKDKYGYPNAMQLWKNEKVEKFFSDSIDNMTDEEVEQYRKENMIYAKHIRPKKFEYKGNIWHHLKVKDPIAVHGSWYLTDYKTWLKAYGKELVAVKRENYSKDHLEVFIERI